MTNRGRKAPRVGVAVEPPEEALGRAETQRKGKRKVRQEFKTPFRRLRLVGRPRAGWTLYERGNGNGLVPSAYWRRLRLFTSKAKALAWVRRAIDRDEVYLP